MRKRVIPAMTAHILTNFFVFRCCIYLITRQDKAAVAVLARARGRWVIAFVCMRGNMLRSTEEHACFPALLLSCRLTKTQTDEQQPAEDPCLRGTIRRILKVDQKRRRKTAVYNHPSASVTLLGLFYSLTTHYFPIPFIPNP